MLELMKVKMNSSILLSRSLLETSQTSYTRNVFAFSVYCLNYSQLRQQMQYLTLFLNLLTINLIYCAVILMVVMVVVLCFYT